MTCGHERPRRRAEPGTRGRSARPGRRARLVMVLLTWPLLQSLTCLDRLQASLVEGFFDAFNPWLIERYERELDEQLGGRP